MQKSQGTIYQERPRKLEELNLIDNFLFQEMISRKDTGEEFAKLLLGTILNRSIRSVKIVPQKNILGTDTDRHGIRSIKGEWFIRSRINVWKMIRLLTTTGR